jgi:hypothetical protein
MTNRVIADRALQAVTLNEPEPEREREWARRETATT